MSNWWKAPVLQGEDNDYGQYDYLIEELPQDYARWELSKYRWECSECKQTRHLLFRSAHHFHTLDGWDSMEHSECLWCYLRGKLHGLQWKANKLVKRFKLARRMYKECNNSFKYYWNLTKKY